MSCSARVGARVGEERVQILSPVSCCARVGARVLRGLEHDVKISLYSMQQASYNVKAAIEWVAALLGLKPDMSPVSCSARVLRGSGQIGRKSRSIRVSN